MAIMKQKSHNLYPIVLVRYYEDDDEIADEGQ